MRTLEGSLRAPQDKDKDKDKDKDMDKEAKVEFNYGILATTDGVCHAGLYTVSDENGDRRSSGNGCRVSQFRYHLTN